MGTDKRERQKANRQQRLVELAKEARRSKTKRTALRIGIGVPLAVAVVFGLIFLVGGDDDDDAVAATTTLPELTTTTLDPSATTTTLDPADTTTTTTPPFAYGTGGCPAADGSSVPQTSFSGPPKLCIDPAAQYSATFTTSKGVIEVALDTAATPGTVNNFVVLALFHYYDDTVIFRADPSIDIIQGGGASSTDSVGYTIPDEGFGFAYSEGDLVMARTAEPNSAGAQWFFVGGPDASNLDVQGTYVTFGEVTEGLDVVKAILALAGEDGQTPTETVTLESVTITTG